MVCKNTGMYGFLGTSWVLITMAPHNSAMFAGGVRFHTAVVFLLQQQ